MIRIVLVDDQAIVREGLHAMLSLESDIQVIGEAASGQEALEIIPRLQPDIALLDVRMPDLDGLVTLERLKRIYPPVAVIMVTLYDDIDYLKRAVAAGAAGYILKDVSRDELVRAIRIVADGGSIIQPTMLRELLQHISQFHPRPSRSPIESPLTSRECEVLALIAEGKTNQEIAEILFVSPTTVKTHIQNILQKLHASDRTQAAVLAIRAGIL